MTETNATREIVLFQRSIETCADPAEIARKVEMPLKPILTNLVEAYGEVAELDDRIHYEIRGKFRPGGFWSEWHAKKQPFTEGSLFVSFEYAYHHLNWACNCRHAKETKVWRFSEEDGKRWGQFPSDGLFAKLWSAQKRDCRPGRIIIGSRGKVVARAMHPWVELARRKLGNLAFIVSHKLGKDSEYAIARPPKLKPGIEDEELTEGEFCRRLWGVYAALNTAWNSRKGRIYGSFRFSRAFSGGSWNMWGGTETA